jgi:DNA (cytosine-5)-methyltransferase 1
MDARLTVLDLFSGIGGFSLGLEWTGGFQTVGFCEVCPKARGILGLRWPDVPLFPDVRELTGRIVNERCGRIDVVCGGFPCQDISLAGKGAGLVGARSGLWFEMHRVISEVRPRWVIAENVAALRSRGLDRVLGPLAAIGYDAEWHCIPASAVGAPHRRDRVWIVAYPNGDGERGLPVDAEVAGKPAADELAYADGGGSPAQSDRDGRAVDGTGCGEGSTGDPARVPAPNRRPDVADSDRPGCVEQRRAEPVLAQLAPVECGGWWSVEPDVGRVAHGVPRRVDRLKQLGNAVVPHIPMLIGKAVLERIGEVRS